MLKINLTTAHAVFAAYVSSDDAPLPSPSACKLMRKHLKLATSATIADIVAAIEAARLAAIVDANRIADAARAAPAIRAVSERIGGFSLSNIARTAGTVATHRYGFGSETNRDYAYLLLFGHARDNAELPNATDAGDMPENIVGRPVSLGMLASYGANPYYTGSNKPHDAGAITRAVKAGYIVRSSDGVLLAFTARGNALLSNLRAKHGAPATVPATVSAEPASE